MKLKIYPNQGNLLGVMVVVAQLVERWPVEPDAAGSSPVSHPNGK